MLTFSINVLWMYETWPQSKEAQYSVHSCAFSLKILVDLAFLSEHLTLIGITTILE